MFPGGPVKLAVDRWAAVPKPGLLFVPVGGF